MPELSLDQLTEIERYAVTAFMAAADNVYRFWRPHRAHPFEARLFRATAPDTARLIPDAEFHALAVAVRVPYMGSEKCHVDKVIEALRPHLDAELASLLDERVAEWNRALSGAGRFIFQNRGRTYQPRDVFDTWLYALTVHRDQKRQSAAEDLRQFDPAASMSLQLFVCDLAIAIVNLDSFLRALLGAEPRDLSDTPLPPEGSTGIF